MLTEDDIDSTPVSAFLLKLWKLVEDPIIDNIVSWATDGHSFLIKNQISLCQNILPVYFKHNNMASFVRQLNMYGFHKITPAESGAFSIDNSEIEFKHMHFIRDRFDLLLMIKRKTQGLKNISLTNEPMALTSDRILTEIDSLRTDQISYKDELDRLRRDHDTMWRNYATIREKFSKQQVVIEKLVRFLVSMVKPTGHPLNAKRKFNQLALEGLLDSSSNLVPGISNEADGPIIHEVTSADHSVCLEKVYPTSGSEEEDISEPSSGGMFIQPTIPASAVKPNVTKIQIRPIRNNIKHDSHVIPNISLQEYSSDSLNTKKLSQQIIHIPIARSSNGSYRSSFDAPQLSPELLDVADPSLVMPNAVSYSRQHHHNQRTSGTKRLKTKIKEENNDPILNSSLLNTTNDMEVALPPQLSATSLLEEGLTNHVNRTELFLDTLRANRLNLDPSSSITSLIPDDESSLLLHDILSTSFNIDDSTSSVLPYDDDPIAQFLSQSPSPANKLQLIIKKTPERPRDEEDPLTTPQINLDPQPTSPLFRHNF